jgi:saccharopine dehydrogenase (NAD+, L-lysine-forming)
MKLAILRETKNPPDRRVPFTPVQCRQLLDRYPQLEICIQPDKNRCFSNGEYEFQGICICEDIADYDLLIGVKEVKTEYLIPGKTYMFFSHTAKKQKHNLGLLKSVIQKKIQLIDYEYLTDNNKIRIVAFGRWAGVVGAYNSLRAYGLRYKKFSLRPAWQCKDKNEVLTHLSEIIINNQKIVITGGGRVAKGAMEILDAVGFTKCIPENFLNSNSGTVYTQLDPDYYVKPRGNEKFDLNHFFKNPEDFENSFLPFTRKADMFIACHFWDPRAPVLMTPDDMRNPEFRIKIIADVSCDINGPIPSTLRPSTIADPFYGYDVKTGKESTPFDEINITVMSVDNLPGELPRDASEDFGQKLVSEVIPAFLGITDPSVIHRATITKDGKLADHFTYLQGFLEGKE